MESAPLTVARVEARRASQADPDGSITTDFAERHVAAAAEFRNAAKDASDSEALRMLKLLEAHHEQVARLLRSQSTQKQSSDASKGQVAALSGPDGHRGNSNTSQRPSAETERKSGGEPSKQPNDDIAVAAASAVSPSVQATTSTSSPKTPRSTSPEAQRRPRREISSSIANNLATARGIRTGTSQKGSSPLSVTERSPPRDLQQGSRSSTTNTSPSPKGPQSGPGARYAAEQEGLSDQPANIVGHGTATSDNEVSFQKFYSTFEGLFSKLSSPLAFAGLPLKPDEHEQASDPPPSSSNPKSIRSDGHHQSSDVTKLFSDAAMRAVKEDHPGLSRPVHESFFVVPTSGGSLSYAAVARQHSLKHSAANPDEQQDAQMGPGDSAAGPKDDDEFVDARESPESKQLSHHHQRVSSKSSPTTGTSTFHVAKGEKTPEELKLENESLRQLTDTLSRRLYMWEKSAQTQTLTLQQSMIQHQQQQQQHQQHHHHQASSSSSPDGAAGRGGGGGGGGGEEGVAGGGRGETGGGAAAAANAKVREEEDKDKAKIEELEKKLAATSQDLAKQARENDKLRTVVLRYRERWEKLKEGARGRRGSSTTTTTAATATATPASAGDAAAVGSTINP